MIRLRNIAILSMLLVAGCNKPSPVSGDFWISGLSLPPGSKVLERAVEKNSESDPGSDIASTKYLTVTFDSTANWDEVVAHFDKKLGSLGFTETSYSRLDMNSSDMSEGDKQILGSERFYENQKTGYAVSILTSAMLDSGAGSSNPLSGLPPFSMVVMKIDER